MRINGRKAVGIALGAALLLICVDPPKALQQSVEQPFRRKLIDWPAREAPTVATRITQSAGAKSSGLIAEDTIPTLQPNDPGYDPAWGALLDLPLMLGELQQRMQAGTLNAQPVYIVILDGSVMSHPDLDPLHESKYDKDFTGTPPGDPTLGSHATGGASITVAKTNNGMGAASIAGFTGTVKFISVRIYDVQGNTSLAGEVGGFNYIASLVDQGVPIVAVSCAFGGPGLILAERDAIKALTNKGVVVFAGAGPRTNDGFYPASFSDTNPMVIPVGKENASGTGLETSDDWGAIAAPTNVKVVVKQSQPDLMITFGGVSASTGQPAAAFALIRSLFPALTPMQALRRLEFSTLPIDGVTFGKLNAYLATTKRVFLVRAIGTTSRAVALDAVNLTAGPFAIKTRYFTSSMNEAATRVMFFAYNLDPTTAPAAITIAAQDSQGRGYNLPVEAVVLVPDAPFLANVIAVLPDTVQGAGDLHVTLSVNGQVSNQLDITVK